MDEPRAEPTDPCAPHSAWRAVAAILLVVTVGYALFPTRLPLYGEETCRALHGIEMATTGDWLVATNQYEPILDRPPLQYWLLAWIHTWIHALDPLTLRLSMAAITAITALVTWWYARRLFGPVPGLVAGVAYPTIGHVFDLGLRVETDGLFALLVAAALMVWHAGYVRRGADVATWCAGGFVAALATLTKGLHGTVTILGTIYIWLLLRRDLRAVFRPAHVAGIAAFLAPIAVWQIPFWERTGWDGFRQTWIDPLTMRLQEEGGVAGWLARFVEFPPSAFGAALPWSLLLIALVFRPFRHLRPQARGRVGFALLAMAVVFLPVWVSRGGLRRYLMPMYPFLAVVCGVVVSQAIASARGSALRRLWTVFVRGVTIGVSLVVLAATVATIAADWVDAEFVRSLVQPAWLLVALGLGCGIAVPVLWRQASSDQPATAGRVALLLALLVAAAWNGPVTNAKAKDVVRVPPQVAELRSRMGPGARLVSFGPLHHRFVYWYPERIPVLPWPTAADDVPPDLEFFAVTIQGRLERELPFAWVPVMQVNMDRKWDDDPVDMVLVGRRLR